MINWTDFEKLSGSAQHNFETLCRATIRLLHGCHGHFFALANQPGLEFHLKLHTNCSLGTPGRWYGWQCRWYDLPSGRALGNTRRKKIEDTLKKSVKVLPDLTDWILWTRHPLTKADQKWYYALDAKLQLKLRLELWNSKDIEGLLIGDADILRRTFFGEWVLTPNTLAQLHGLSVAPIRKRWVPEAHQIIDAERVTRRMLGEATSWGDIPDCARRLIEAINIINMEPRAFAEPLSSSTQTFILAARTLAEALQDTHLLIANGDLELLWQRLKARPLSVSHDIPTATRKLRGARLACGLDATNALADIQFGIQLLSEVQNCLGTRLVGLVADAGGGKTQLAAQLTAATRERPAGILLHGRDLHSGKTLNDLAKTIVIQGNPIPSMEALLASVDAAGQRARRRLPLVIDGLNEAEDPREWKQPLAALNTLLQQFANVLVICTVRTGARRPAEQTWPPRDETPARMDFADQALPDDIQRIAIPDFGGDTLEAIRKYFHAFKINPGDAELPLELLSHPLSLRIFCEVTNPERKREVGIEAMPGSLASMFEQYLAHAAERISELAPRSHRYFPHDVRALLDFIGTALWDKRVRELPEHDVRKTLGDDARPWNESIIQMLEQEGVILLIPGDSPGKRSIIAVYDALAGYLIATAILKTHGRTGLVNWLKDPATLDGLNGHTTSCHPLASDIFRALVGLIPRDVPRQQLWELVDEPLRTTALQFATTLEGRYLDSATVAELANLLRQPKPVSNEILVRLFRTRSAVEHPLNANFLDSVLRSMTINERDLNWTEWVRQNHDAIQKNSQELENRWQNNVTVRTPSDRLRAKWIMWLLTTTIHNLRDRVTRALYWFGRGDPAALFEFTVGAVDINDPYVFERMLAASYGVAMAAHCDSRRSEIREVILPEHARQIFCLLFKEGATYRTTHLLTREYGRRFIELALLYNRKLLSADELIRLRPPYSDPGRISWQEVKASEDEISREESPFRMDFENYSLGHLVEGRSNYDYKHAGYRKVHAQVLWRVQQLGWTPERFERIDDAIDNSRRSYSRTSDEHEKIDRYGKKYSWIAYFELGGWLKDQGLLNKNWDEDRPWDLDIDPSFPSPMAEHQVISVDLLGDQNLSLPEWIDRGPIPNLTPYLRQQSIRGDAGPWVALDGFVSQQDESRGQSLFAFAQSFLVSKKEARALVKLLSKQPLGGRWLPEKPQSHVTFAGEIPWCDAFRKTEFVDLQFVIKERKVKVKRKRPFYFLDGKPIQVTPFDLMRIRIIGPSTDIGSDQPSLTEDDLKRVVRQERMVKVEETQKDLHKLQTLIPVYDLRLVGRSVDNLPISGITLAKQLAQGAKLIHLPQTYDLQTKNGERATYGVVARPHDFKNSQKFFFVRESILQEILRKHKLSLVWAIWGERELSYKKMMAAKSGGETLYANFQSCHLYK